MKSLKLTMLAWGLTTVISVNAQGDSFLDKTHIGIIGGLHNTSMSFSDLNKNYFDDPKSTFGGVFGIYAEFELGDSRQFSLRPQLSFLSRESKIEDIKYLRGTGTGQLDYTLSASYTDLRVPIMYNFGSPGGVRPYIYVAPTLGLVRGGDITLEDAVSKYSIDVTDANMASTYFAVAPGVGVKIPVGVVDLGIEASYEFGLTDTYGSKEKDGKAYAYQFFPVYNIKGTRKFSGFEIAAHVSVPLSVFKHKGGTVKRTVVYEEPRPVRSQNVVIKKKPCYTLDEIISLADKGESVRGLTICAINDINFEYNKSVLTASSRRYIDKIISLMQRTNVSVEVKGHTDSSGSDEYNMKLSKERAESVYNYMLSKGVNKRKLSYSYYGETKPIASNSIEEGRRNNRRVEFEIK